MYTKLAVGLQYVCHHHKNDQSGFFLLTLLPYLKLLIEAVMSDLGASAFCFFGAFRHLSRPAENLDPTKISKMHRLMDVGPPPTSAYACL